MRELQEILESCRILGQLQEVLACDVNEIVSNVRKLKSAACGSDAFGEKYAMLRRRVPDMPVEETLCQSQG